MKRIDHKDQGRESVISINLRTKRKKKRRCYLLLSRYLCSCLFFLTILNNRESFGEFIEADRLPVDVSVTSYMFLFHFTALSPSCTTKSSFYPFIISCKC